MFADAIEFTIKGDDMFEARDFAEWNLKPRLQTVPGVSNVINLGGYLKQYHVLLDPNKLLNYGISIHDVMLALKENNINSSGGFIVKGPEEKIIRGMGRIKSIDDIQGKVIAYTDAASTSGFIYPSAILKQQHINPANSSIFLVSLLLNSSSFSFRFSLLALLSTKASITF